MKKKLSLLLLLALGSYITASLPVIEDVHNQKRIAHNPQSTDKKSVHRASVDGQPMAPISIGELIDKITILQIKLKKIRDPEKLENVCFEMRTLNETMQLFVMPNSRLNELTKELLEVNQKLWKIEDDLRAKEAQQIFDREFIELARSVYFTNDERGRLKRQINELTGSRIVEEKQYTEYQ